MSKFSRKGAKALRKTTKFFVRQPAEALRETKVAAQTLKTRTN